MLNNPHSSPLLVIVVRLVQILVDIVTPTLPGQVDEDTGGWLAPLWQAEAAVADLPTGRTHPLPVQQGLPHTFPIPVLQAWPAELTSDPTAVLVMTDGFCVYGLLPALVASGAVRTIIDLV